ncbi:MAG TPA: phosphoribosylglycinamide synthetase C domain-containing protein, partial [Sphaerochaeta sp.]|nr:phosphoribosylglycinamide synthetase C domain-containing protein [Sphaerochaeta sp.]
PKVIEYNARFGDPELQAILPLLESDLLSVLVAVSQQRLKDIFVEFSSLASCCVVLASGGYPTKYETGKKITLGDTEEGIMCFHAGTTYKGSALVTNGGRVMNIVSTAETLPLAIEKAYRAVGSVSFEGMRYRKDIGKVALEA